MNIDPQAGNRAMEGNRFNLARNNVPTIVFRLLRLHLNGFRADQDNHLLPFSEILQAIHEQVEMIAQ